MAQGKPETLDAALAQLPPTFGVRCKTCQLPPKLLADVEARLRAGEQRARISRALRLLEHSIDPNALARHVRDHAKTTQSR